MRANVFGILILAVGCNATPIDDAAMKTGAKASVDELQAAVVKGDFGKVADLSHPMLVKKMGGREKMVAWLGKDISKMKADGAEFRTAQVGDPSDPMRVGGDHYIVVPFTLGMSVRGGTLLQKSFVIGVSADGGRTWTFVNGDLDVNEVKQVLPKLPDGLKLPANEKPVFFSN